MSSSLQSKDDNCIRLRVEKWSQLTNSGIHSATKIIQGFPWKFRANKDADNQLYIILYAFKDEESNVWFCDVSVDILLISQIEGGDNYKINKTKKHIFTHENCDNGISFVLDQPRLLEDPAMGIVKNESFTIEARVTVNSRDGRCFRKKRIFDPFSPSPMSDGIIVIGDRKLFVSKQLLATQSAYFESLFFGKFKESTEPETHIQEVEIDQFVVLLRILYRAGQTLSAENVEFIMKLADRFEMMPIMDLCEKYLLTPKGPTIHTKLRLADKFNLFVLHEQLIGRYNADLIRELNKSTDFGMLKEETKDILFKKYIELTSPK